MTDYYQACTNIKAVDVVVTGSKGDKYRTSASVDGKSDYCNCPGYRFRGECKHIKFVKHDHLCSWSELTGEAQSPQDEMTCKCPRCGNETEVLSR